MVFDVIVGSGVRGFLPSIKLFRNILPSISMQFVHLEQFDFLLAAPRQLVHAGVQMVVPPLSALLASPLQNRVILSEFCGDFGPVFDAELCDKFRDGLVFLDRGNSTSLVQDCLFIRPIIFIFIDPTRNQI